MQQILNDVRKNPDFHKAGAVATFTGVVRGENRHKKVERLVFEAYEQKANEILSGICRDLKRKKGITDVQIHHMTGKFAVGDDLVYVIVAGSHRKQVFRVLEEAVERYKKEAPIFKKEYTRTEEGKIEAFWVGEKSEPAKSRPNRP